MRERNEPPLIEHDPYETPEDRHKLPMSAWVTMLAVLGGITIANNGWNMTGWLDPLCLVLFLVFMAWNYSSRY